MKNCCPIKKGDHETHFACQEVLNKYGDKSIGCCCTGHECKPFPKQEKPEWNTTFEAIIRENLVWYKENGNDHGDLVIAEEAIKSSILKS